MSEHRSRNGGDNTVVIVVGGLLGLVVIVCVTAVAIAVEDGARAASMIGLITPLLFTMLGFFGVFLKVQGIQSDVREVKQDTYDLTNGLGTAKHLDSLGTVLPDHLIDPAAAEQIAAARERLRLRSGAVETAERLIEPRADLD